MDRKYRGLPGDDGAIVYIRPVEVGSLPEDLREQAGGRDIVYSVHRADGAHLALVSDRALAFDLARQHDLAPVSVH